MNFSSSSLARLLFASGTSVWLLASSHAAIIPPSWFGDPNTTYQSYTFTTDSTTPAPEEANNPYGTPVMDITFVPYIAVGIGYLDESSTLSRVGGAWDLGPDGFMQVQIPFAPVPAPGITYNVDVYVQVVYEPTPGFYNPPDTIFSPPIVANTTTNPTFELQGFFYWGLRTTEGTIGEVPANLLAILIDATGSTGSIVDTVEIHTRFVAVPEPAHFAIGLGVCALIGVLARRRTPAAH